MTFELARRSWPEGYPVKHEDLATLGPYPTRHVKRFGDYAFTVTSPEPFDGELAMLVPNDGVSLQVATASAACGLFLQVSRLHPCSASRPLTGALFALY